MQEGLAGVAPVSELLKSYAHVCHFVEEQQRAIKDLRRQAAESQEQICVLKQCLEHSGALSARQFSAQLHRRRFSVAVRQHNFCSESKLSDVLALLEIAHMVGAFAGPKTLRYLTRVSKAIGAAASRALPKVSAELPSEIYIFGGGDGEHLLSTVEHFDPRSGAWASTPMVATARVAGTAVAMGGLVYVCGGWYWQHPVSMVETFSLETHSWASAPSMVAARAAASSGVAVDGEQIVVCGGFNDCQEALSSCETLKLRSDQWEEMQPMMEQRGSAAAAVVRGALYVCGGYDARLLALKRVERYVFATRTWEAVPSMRAGRAGASAAALAGCLIVCGGQSGAKGLSSVERFCPERDSWEELPSMSVGRSNAMLAATAEYLHVFGGQAFGQGQVSRLSSAERLDMKLGAWVPLPPMLTKRMHAVAVATRW